MSWSYTSVQQVQVKFSSFKASHEVHDAAKVFRGKYKEALYKINERENRMEPETIGNDKNTLKSNFLQFGNSRDENAMDSGIKKKMRETTTEQNTDYRTSTEL